MKKLINLLLFICLVSVSVTAQADLFEKVLKDKTMRIGVSLFEPWAMQKEDGQLYGYEIQVANQLAKDMGVTAEFVVVDWEDIIDSLEQKKFDVIIGGMAVTPERALRVNFSNSYSSSGIGIVANLEKTKDIGSLGELNLSKVKIGAVTGTVSEGLAKKVFYRSAIELFTENQESIDAVVSGKIHALVASYPTPKFVELEYPDKVDVPLQKPLLKYETGMAVNKGEQELLNYLNAWVIAKRADGWLEAKYDYWFNSLEWRTQ